MSVKDSRTVCFRGHTESPRNARGQCVQCAYEYNKERRAANMLSWKKSLKLMNAIRHKVFGLDDIPDEYNHPGPFKNRGLGK